MRKPTLQFASIEDLLDFCERAQLFNGVINKDQLLLTAYLNNAAMELAKQAYGAKEISFTLLALS